MKNFIVIAITLLLTACNANDEVTAISKLGSQDRVWAYMQFNIPEEGDKFESYYYFGEVSEDLLNMISENQINEGFISINNVKYWGDNDKVVDYADDEYSGNLVFRIENIERIEKMNGEPNFGNEADTAVDDNETQEQVPEQAQEPQAENTKTLENNISSPASSN